MSCAVTSLIPCCCWGRWGSLPVLSPTWENTEDRCSSKSLFLLLFGKENCLPSPAFSAGDLCAPFLVPLSSALPWAPGPAQQCCWWRAGSFQPSRVKIQGWGAALVPQRGRACPRECEGRVEEMFFLLSQAGPKSSFRLWTPKCAGVWGRREGKRCSAVQEAWAELQDVFTPDPLCLQLSGSSWRAKHCSRSSVCSGEGCPWKRSAGLKPLVQRTGGAEVSHLWEMV